MRKYNDLKKPLKPIIEKKINLATPIYLYRKININNITQERKTPKNVNYSIRENKLNFALKNKNSNQSIKSAIMNSFDITKNKDMKTGNNHQKNNNSNIGLISQTISHILNYKKENNENGFLVNKKLGKKIKKSLNENKENIRTNYNDSTNISINLNNYNNINKLENNLNINNLMFQTNNLYSTTQRNNYIKKKIINFGQRKNENNNGMNIRDLYSIRNTKETETNKNRTQNFSKNAYNIINNDNNCLSNRIIHEYTSSNGTNLTNNIKNYFYDNNFVGNSSSFQKRKISFHDYSNTPDSDKKLINYRIKDNSGNRVVNSCYFDNILSFRKVKPNILYRSPLNKCAKVNFQIGKTIRDFTEAKNDFNWRKKSFLLKANLIKHPSSRVTTFKKLNIKNNLNANNQNSFFSLNYTYTDSNDNTSMDSCNKKIIEKIKKSSIYKQKNNAKIKKENFSKTIKEYSRKDNKKPKIERKNNKLFPGIIQYYSSNKDKFKKISHRTMSNFNTRRKKNSNLLDINEILAKVIKDKEISEERKEKKFSKSSSSLHHKKLCNDKISVSKKNKFKIITPKKLEKKNKISYNSTKIISQENLYQKELDKNIYKLERLSESNKTIQNSSNMMSKIVLNYQNNSDNAAKNPSGSSFVSNEEAKKSNNNTKLNTVNNNINIKIYEEEKIIDFDLFYTLESKLKMLLIKINKYQVCYNECQDWLSYFFGINFHENELILFNSEQNKKKMIYFIKFELLCFLMCYDISFNKNYNQTSILLKTIFNLLHKNFLTLISFAINSIYGNKEKNEYKDINCNNSNYIEQMIIIKKLQEVINNELKMNLEIQDVNESVIIQILSYDFNQINNYYEMIIDNIYSNHQTITNKISLDNNKINCYKFPECLKINILKLNDKKKAYIISEFFKNAMKSIDLYSIKEFKIFFNLYLNKSTDNLFIQQFFNNKRMLSLIPCPPSSSPLNPDKILLPQINKEKYNYTIIFDLDETLIYLEKEYYTFNNIHNIKNKKLTLRPGLFHFLDKMKKIYELILFTFSSPEYANPIIKLIEKDEKYFEHILYIQQASFINGNYVKNIKYLGRDINKTIIIEDNINNIYKFNRDNTICIKPFYGDIANEKNTLQFLGKILNKVRYDAEITGDITKSLNKEKYNIITEISSNLEE